MNIFLYNNDMKIKRILVAFIISIIGVFLSSDAIAYFLDEQILRTKDGKCQIHYLSEKNTRGWYFETGQNKCDTDGWLDGYHNITIYNAFLKPVEKLYGYFSKGYWTGDAWIETPLLTRSSEELGVQKATFYVANNADVQIDYIGQMVAKKGKDGSYSKFNVCEPFRLLAVTKQIGRFENPRFLQLVFKDVEKNIRRFCPAEKNVMLFVSPVLEPDQSDIAFYADIDLEKHSSEIIWKEDTHGYKTTKEVERVSEKLTDTQNETADETDLKAIRHAVYQKIHQINPYIESAQPERIIISEKSYQPDWAFPVGNSSKIQLGTDDSLDMNAETLNQIEGWTGDISEELNKNETGLEVVNSQTGRHVKYIFDELDTEKDDDNLWKTKLYDNQGEEIVSPKKQNVMLKEKQQSSIGQLLQNLKTEPAAHLLILSKIKKEAVLGRAVVHVSRPIDSLSAIADVPFALTLRGKGLESGWYMVTGYFDGKTRVKHQKIRGKVRILKALACQTKFCRDE